MKINYNSIAKWISILILDYLVVMVCCLLLIRDDCFYDESMGDYWTLVGYDSFQKIVFIFLNLWLLLNFLFFILVLWTGWKKFKNA